jgi:hypothetical protein
MPSRGTKYSFMRVVGRDIVVDISDETLVAEDKVDMVFKAKAKGKARQDSAMQRAENQSESRRERKVGESAREREREKREENV